MTDIFYRSVKKKRLNAFLAFISQNASSNTHLYQYVDEYELHNWNDLQKKILLTSVKHVEWKKNRNTDHRYCSLDLIPLDKLTKAKNDLTIRLIATYGKRTNLNICKYDWLAVANAHVIRHGPNKLDLSIDLEKSLATLWDYNNRTAESKKHFSRQSKMFDDGTEQDIPRELVKKHFSRQSKMFDDGTEQDIPRELPNKVIQVGLVGLNNVRNSCYANAVLQVMGHIQLIRELASNSTPTNLLNKSFRDIIFHLWEDAPYSVFDTKLFKKHVGEEIHRFANDFQQDSHEYFLALLDKISLEHTMDNKSIRDLFVGEVNDTSKCKICGYTASVMDQFVAYTVPVPKREAGVYMSDLISKTLRRSNTTSHCGEMMRHSVTFAKFPQILAIHLSRFRYLTQQEQGIKVETKVQFPTKLKFQLDDSLHVYELHSVINHDGTSLEVGHYTTIIHHEITGEWVKFDDEKVTLVKVDEVQSKMAYIIFYKRLLDNL